MLISAVLYLVGALLVAIARKCFPAPLLNLQPQYRNVNV